MLSPLSEPEKESSSAKKKKHKKVQDFVLNITVPLECSFVRKAAALSTRSTLVAHQIIKCFCFIDVFSEVEEEAATVGKCSSPKRSSRWWQFCKRKVSSLFLSSYVTAGLRSFRLQSCANKVSLTVKRRTRWANQFWVGKKRPVAAVHFLSKPLMELPCRQLP